MSFLKIRHLEKKIVDFSKFIHSKPFPCQLKSFVLFHLCHLKYYISVVNDD